MMKNAVVLALLGVLVSTSTLRGQEGAGWERRSGPVEAPVTVFHSTQAVNLPTAEMLSAGEWLFEISHRFLPPVSDGSAALWGFDGPVFNRLGLAYAVSDGLMLGVLRTNLDDNLELNAKVRIAAGEGESFAWMVGAMGGVALNTQEPVGADDNESQAYGQVMVDALLGDRFAVGVVPTLLYNPVVASASTVTDFVLGLHAQFYVSAQMSLLGEWIVTPEHADASADLENDGGSFGIELETGGHFFKVVLSNQVRMNPTQFLAGAALPFEPGEWRVGFNITRVIAF